MFHFSKYLAIAITSMSIMKAGVINIPLPHGFPQANFLFAKEISITQRDWIDARIPAKLNPAPENPFPHLLKPVSAKLLNLQKDERHLLSGANFIWDILLIENIYSEQYSPEASKNGFFDQKIAAGLKVNQNFFIKLNVAFWGTNPVNALSSSGPAVPLSDGSSVKDGNLLTNADNRSFCVYPSILLKTSWFNVDIGFGKDTKLRLEKSDYQSFKEIRETLYRSLQNVNFDNLLSFPLRINVSFNLASLGGQ